MLKKFEVSNYKNFKEPVQIMFDKIGGYQFNSECITNDNISKMLIYGRNATGKTNLGKALMDIFTNMSGVHFYPPQKGSYLNADSDEKFATFKYEFQFKDNKVKYVYKKLSEAELLDEELIINDNRIFYYNFETKEYDFNNLSNIEADTVNVERYLQGVDVVNAQDDENQTLPFLRWIINNTAFKEDSILLFLDDYIKKMSMITVGSGGLMRPRRFDDSFYEILDNNNALNDFQEFLNIMGIKCELVLKSLPDGQKELYFKHKKLVPFFETASSGTWSLINLYRRILIGRKSSMLYMDEFDAFYHYEMAENVIRFFKMKYPECQIVMTTHNTNLMTNRIMRPDCLFILSQQGTLTALCDSTERELREGHNLEKMYISGEFDKYE
ncbi:MAG: ATP-binding protein [Lachnospiraceae bacterium]